MVPWGKSGVDSMSLGMHVGRFARPVGLSLLAVGVAAASAGAVSAHQTPTSSVSSATAVERGVATPIRAQQLVFPMGRFFVRKTPGSQRRPARILPIRQMSATNIDAFGHRIYWLNRDQKTFKVTVRSVASTGAHPRTLVRRVGFAAVLAASRQHVYWDASNGSAISRVAVDGSRVQRRWLVGIRRQSSGDIVDGLATDRRFLYLSQCFSGRIGRVPLNARPRNRHVEWIVRGINTCPQNMTVSGGFIYWAGFTRSGAGVIGRAPVAGGPTKQTWTRIRTSAGPSFLAAINGFIYWDWGGSPDGAPSFVGRISENHTKFTRKFRRIGPWPITAVSR